MRIRVRLRRRRVQLKRLRLKRLKKWNEICGSCG
jgi:hypothetical protein